MAAITRMAHRDFAAYLNTQRPEVNGLQFAILQLLAGQSMTISELSRKMLLDPSTLVPVIDTMERKEFLVRKRDPNDRRRIPLTLTQEGSHILREISYIREDDVMVQSLKQMGSEKAHQLSALLREMMMQMPEGEEIFNELQARMLSCDGKHPRNPDSQS